MLLHLRIEDKLHGHDDIDRIISAEIPVPNLNDKPEDAVKSWMIHGSCGHLNPDSICMDFLEMKIEVQPFCQVEVANLPLGFIIDLSNLDNIQPIVAANFYKYSLASGFQF